MARSVYVVSEDDEVCIGTVDEVLGSDWAVATSLLECIRSVVDAIEYGEDEEDGAELTIELR